MALTISYHTHLINGDGVGDSGVFSGDFSINTVDRLVSQNFEVKISPAGLMTYVDSYGREVYLYVYAPPEETTKGKEALTRWRDTMYAKAERVEQVLKAQREELQEALDSLPHEEIMRRLKGRNHGKETSA